MASIRLWLLRVWTCLTILAGLAGAQAPALVTVQDTIYNPDGTRFNGYLILEWKTPQGVTVAQQSRNVRVVNGLFSVSLASNTGVVGSYYNVKYSSGGYIRVVERWTVPASSSVLTIASVRGSGSGGNSGGSSSPAQLLITDVSGLGEELTLRPIKAVGFTAGRAAVINNSGAIDGATGSASDCLRVDGTSAPCSASIQFVDGEIPTGTLNGVNAAFALANTPSPSSSVRVYRNGLLMKQGADYTVAGTTITFLPGAIPQSGDALLADYRY